MFLNLLITFGTLGLILISVFIVLLVLMQRSNPNAGLGSTLGGVMAESAFGSETNSTLMKTTIWCAVAFFVVCMLTSMAYIARKSRANNTFQKLPVITAPDVVSIPTDTQPLSSSSSESSEI